MRYELLDKGAEELVAEVVLEGSEAERKAVLKARDLGIVVDDAALFLRSNAVILQSLPEFGAIMKLVLADAADEAQKDLLTEYDILPAAEPRIQLTDGDFAREFRFMVKIPLVVGASAPTWRGLTVKAHPVRTVGNEVDERIREACEHYAVADGEELIAKTGLYPSAEAMVAALEESLNAFVERVNIRAKEDGACEALLEANGFSMPPESVEEAVSAEIGRMEDTLGSLDLAKQLEITGMTEERFRTEMAETLEKSLRLDILLNAIALLLPRAVSDRERAGRLMAGVDGGQPVSREEAETMLESLKAQPGALRYLDQAIRRDRAVAAVVEAGELKQQLPMTLNEYLRFTGASAPLR